MSARAKLIYVVVLVAVFVALPVASAKDKNSALPGYVLKAETVMVVIQPDAGESLTSPAANRTARENVEKALSQWGRFRLVTDASVADLIIAVQKAHTGGPTINNSPTDNPPVTIQSGGGTTRVGVQEGRPSDLTYPLPGQPTGPRPGGNFGAAEDSFEVYQGRVQYPLDAAPIWRYRAKDALNEPQVAAVERFHKAINEAEKQQQHKP
jgi:hypothetical protein